MAWLQRVVGTPHNVLLFLLYIAYSIVPVVTFVLAVVDMDLEKAKYVAPPRMAAIRIRRMVLAIVLRPLGQTMALLPGRGIARVQVPRQVQGNAVPQGNGNGVQGNTGWRFPFQQKAAQAGTTSANGANPE